MSLVGSRRQVTVPANATVPYGELLVIVAKVTAGSSNTPLTSGAVRFTEDGGAVRPEYSSSAVCQAVPVVKGTASCAITALAARQTSYHFGATFTPSDGSLSPSQAVSAPGAVVTVGRASSNLTLTGGSDPSSPGDVRLRAVVSDSSAGSRLAPTGTVSFEQGGVALTCAQGQPILTEASPSSSSVSCDVPAPSGATTYSALYVPTNSGDYAASGPTVASVTSRSVSTPTGSAGATATAVTPAPTGPSRGSVIAHTSTTCSSDFSTLWSDSASGSTTLTFAPGTPVATLVASFTLTEAQTSGPCDPTASIAVSSGSLSFLGNTLSGSGLGGTITDATSPTTSPQLCITSGNLTGEGLTLVGSLCFSISNATSTGATIDNLSSVSLSQSGSVGIISSVLTLSNVNVTISNATPPSTCTVSTTGDWWLSVSGSLALTLSTPSVSATATATGCVDLSAGTKGTLELTSDLGSIALGSSVTLTNFDLTLTYSSTGFGALGTAAATIDMGTGGSLALQLSVAFDSSGALVVGGSADLSNFLPSSLTNGGNVSAFLAYATAAYPGFDTGLTSIGTLDLVPGLTFAIATALPSSITDALKGVNIVLPSTVLAVGSFDTSTDTFSLAITVTFSPAVQLFDNQGVALNLDSASVTLSVSPKQVSISFALNGTLFPNGTGTGADSVPVVGTLSAEISATPSVSISVSVNEPTLGNCGTGSGWSNAFGDTGLTVQCAELTVGVTSVFPFVTGSINGVISSLPTSMASAIGYQQGAAIAFAFGFNPYYLDLSIGAYNSTTPALEPLAAIGSSYATALQVDYAQLCFMLPGADPLTLGDGLTCSAGYILAFTATVDVSVFKDPVTVSVRSSVSIGNPSGFNFSISISQITVGSDLSIGPVNLVFCVSTAQTCDNGSSYFQFEFDGSVSLSGSATVPDFVQVSGSLSLSLTVSLTTSGFTALVSGSGSGSITFWNALSNCSGTWYDPTTWYCAGSWGSTASVSFSLGSTGISASSSGVTVSVDGTSITFPFSSASQTPVPPPSTSTALSSSVNGATSTTSTYGQPVTLTATVSATGGTFDGGGTVSFYLSSINGQFAIPGCSGTHAVSLQNSSGTYTATCTTSTDVVPSSGDTMILPAGSDSVFAQYSGDTTFPLSTSSTVSETVNAATPTLTFSSNQNPDSYGLPVTFSTTVSPTDGGGTVTFQDNGTTISGCAGLALAGDAGFGLGTDDTAGTTCSAGKLMSAGTHRITVLYSGDASAIAAKSTTDYVINKDNTAATVTVAPTQATFGNESASVFTVSVTTTNHESLPTTDDVTVHVGSTTCTAHVAPSTGGGTGTCSIPNTALGASTSAYLVTATYPGDADLNAAAQATAPVGLTVNKDHTVTTVAASPSSAPYATETAVVFTATVQPHYGETGPSGETVTIVVGSTSCVASLVAGSGSCSIPVAVLPVGGPYTLSVTYSGDANFLGSSGTGSFSVTTSWTPDCSSFAGANLAGRNFGGANLGGCDLVGANLQGANLVGVNLAGANLAGANLKGANLTGDNLVGADLRGANLMGVVAQFANWQGVHLDQANLKYADLYLAYDFSSASLVGANLQCANLAYADLEGSNLTNANFMYANLQGANLTNAITVGTQFRGANLAGVIT